MPMLFWLSVAAICISHVFLCEGAATSRSDLTANELISCFVAPFFAFVPALFDDRKTTRCLGVTVLSVGLGFTYGVVNLNLDSARPHPGAHLGPLGLMSQSWLAVPLFMVVPSLTAYACLYFYERVTGDLWSIFRRLRQNVADGSAGN